MVMKTLYHVCLIFLVSLPTNLKADTWYDPSFREMMTTSDLIGVFRVVEGGSFKARLVPVTVYKGKITGEIWIGGFSNKYGPIDSLAVGESYLLFINKVKKHKSRYGSSSHAGNQGIAQASYEASAFVRGQKNGYFVPTPTSGEYPVVDGKVFLDLAEINENVERFPLEDLRRLVEYQSKGKVNDFAQHCKTEIHRNLSTGNVYLLTNYLSALDLLGDASYDQMFDKIASNLAWQTRFTLAKLLGSIKGPEPRDLLVGMIEDTVGIVQGEAIRQLAKREPASFLGPLLVRQLDSASTRGMYPSLMSAVRNQHHSGKIQIIESLADMNYTPAIPYLISVLRTKDEYTFKQTLQALTKLGSKDLVAPLNDRLNDPDLSASILFNITRVIKDQMLTQCKEGLLTQMAKHNRNHNRSKTIALSTLVTLAEHDPSIEPAILKDFEHFFTYYDTLQSHNQKTWIQEYIAACAGLKSEPARTLVYRALYEWSGFNPKLFTSVNSFSMKLQKEDSIRKEFSNILGAEGYRMNSAIHFTSAPSLRQSFLVSVIMPDSSASFSFERRKFLADIVGIAEANIFLKANESWCWLDCQERFEQNNPSSPIKNFIKYAEACPNQTDLKFLKSLMVSDRWEAKYFDGELARAVERIEAALSNRKN
jgi:hypothetical protein